MASQATSSEHELTNRKSTEASSLTNHEQHRSPRSASPAAEPVDEPVDASELGSIDVFGFITNKMIGTGIIVYPAMVLYLTGNRDIAMVFWVVGFLYTLVSMYIYLSFASVLPYNGGELVYVDEASSYDPAGLIRSKLGRILHVFFGNGLLLYTIYSFIFVGTFNSGTNCMQIARQVLLVTDPTKTEPHGASVRFIAIFALCLICLLHYFSVRVGRQLNVTLSIFKVCLLLLLIIKGLVMIAKGQTIGTFDAGAQASHSEYAKAILLIIFSYEGWENAAFVAGEIPRNRHYVLRRGFLSAVFVVGILYITLVAIFLYGLLDYTSDGSTSTIRTDVSFAPLLFGGSVAAEKAFGVLIAISAIGSVISIVYTFARVKQAIGHMNILPWSRLWKADDRQHANNYHSDLERSPMGGLILHALTTIIVISATAAIPNIIDAISFPGIMQTYAHSIISIVVALGLPRLRFRAELLGFDDEDDLANWHALDRKLIRPWHSEKWYAVVPLILLLLVYAACNLFVVIEYCIPPYNGVDGWVPLLIFGILTVAAVIYYFAIFASFFLRELPPRSGERRKHGFSILKWVNTTVQIEKTEEFDMFSSDARRFGKRRSITYRHAVGGNWWVYWLFGGEVAPPSPWEDLMTALDSLKFWRRW